MSILTRAIDESRKRKEDQAGTVPGASEPGPAVKGNTPLTRAIDQARRRRSAGQTADSAVTKPRLPGVEETARLINGTPPTVPASLPRLWESRTTLPAPSAPARSAQSLREEMDGLDTAIRELRQRRSQVDTQAAKLEAFRWQNAPAITLPYEAAGETDTESANPFQTTLRDRAQELAGEIARLERDRAGLQAEWSRAEEREFELGRRTAVPQILDGPIGKSVPGVNPAHNDLRWAMKYFQHKQQGNEAEARADLMMSNMALNGMSEEQRDRLVWYVSRGEYDRAADYLRNVIPGINREQSEQLEQGMSDWAQEHPVPGAAANVVSWPLNIPAYFDNARQAVENAVTGEDRRSPYLTSYSGPRIGSGTAQGAQEAARSAATQATGSELAGDAAAFLTGTGLSIGQNATQIAALGPLSLPAMALSAAGGSTADALDRGATPGQAFALGTASGAIEAITEKLPLDNLFRLAKEGGRQGVKATAKELLKQMGIEATEEAISEIAGNIADAAVMGDSSEFQIYVRELQNAGLSEEEARNQAFLQFYVWNTLASAAGGAISGGVMGGGALAAYQMSPEGRAARTNARTNAAIDQAYAAMQEKGLFSPEAGLAAKTAADRLDKARRGPWDGIYLPRGDEGPVILPQGDEGPAVLSDGETAAKAPQRPAEAGEANGNIPAPSTGREAVQGVQNAAEKAGTVQGRDPAPAGEVRPGSSRGLEGIRETVRMMQEGLAQGRISDGQFDAMMDSIEAQAALEGLELSELYDLMDRESAALLKGDMDNGAGTAVPEGRQLSDGDGGRLSGTGAGGEAGGMAKSGPQGPTGTGRGTGYRGDSGQPLRTEAVSSRELGLVNGTDARTARVLPEEAWDEALRDTARRTRRETGLPVRFVLGGIQVTGADGGAHQVRGVYSRDGAGIIVQADNSAATAKQIADHEIFHSYAQADPGLVRALEEAVTERYGREELRDILVSYAKNLRGITDASGLDAMDPQALDEIRQEMLADAFAGINAFGTEAVKYQETVRETLEDRGTVRPQGRENARATDGKTGPPSAYSINYDQDNRPFVTVEEDILEGVPREDWVRTVKDNLRKKFPNGVTVGNNEIKIDKQSRREMTMSRYMQRIFNTDPQVHADKLRAANNADELLRASQNWVNEALLHPRKDDIIDFARGEVQFRVGKNDYSAQVIVGNRGNGELLLYDIIGLTPTTINERTAKTGTGYTDGTSEEVRGRGSAPVSEHSIAPGDSSVKPWDGTLPRGTDGELTLPGGEDSLGQSGTEADRRGQERYSAEDEPDGVPLPRGDVPDGSTLPTLAEVQARREQSGETGRSEAKKLGKTGNIAVEYDEAEALPAKARNYLLRAERRLTDKLGELLNVPRSGRTEAFQETVRSISNEYLNRGQVPQETMDRLLGLGTETDRAHIEEAAADLVRELEQVKRYADERTLVKNPLHMPTSTQEAAALYDQMKGAYRVYQRAARLNLLTQHDEIQVGRLLRGELELEHLDPAKDNVRGITAVYEAKQEYERLAKTIQAWNQQRKKQLRTEADEYLETANQWKDKKAGILYSRETMERNIRDIVPDQDLADRINKRYFQPVHQAAAAANRMKNEYRDRVRALKLSRRKAAGNAVSEAHAVQLLGEAEDNIRWLEEGHGLRKERDGKTLQEWQGVIGELWENSPNLDQKKIRGAVQEFRTIYDELFQKMNEARVRNGYEPVSYRQGYFPHFQADSEGLMAQFGRALGIDTAVTNLPTTINGLTHTFKPGIQWFGNALERKGFDTAYDAVQGFDRYIEGAADVIHQTDNIQALRALEAQARYRTGDEGLRRQVDQVRAKTDLTEQEKQTLIDEINKDGRFALSNFVVELDEYTNLLANKKSRADRNMEQAMGRRMYNIVKGLESRVAANMVAVNPASWLTNFVPLTQGWGAVNTRFMLEGMWDTLKACKEDDGMVGMSSFLTNRRGSDPIVKTLAQGASAFLSKPMELIDSLTADSLVRARFKQNRASGLSEAASIEEADAWAAGLMADRSKGSTPTLFNRSNPLTKVFTQFQLEVNNQLSYLFKDVPREAKEKGLAALCAMLFKIFIGAYLYNEVYEYFTGRRCALDPIGILNDSVGDFTGYQMPNLVGMAVDAAQGNEISFETEKKKPFDAVTGMGANVAEELPFIGGVLGGGRVPISSALPDWENLAKAAFNDQWSGKKRATAAAKELVNPLTYLALPFGGGQIKKIYQGLKAVAEGGSWTVDNEGNDILQYPVFNDSPLILPTALAFGKSSLPTAREWAESGFKSLSAKETACYQGMTGLGVPQRDAYQLLQTIKAVKAPTGEDVAAEERAAYQKRKLLQEADISAQGKGVVYYTLLASDKERELMDSLNEGGADMGEAARVLMELKDAGALETGKSEAKKEAIAESSLSEVEKDAIFRYMLGRDSTGAEWSTRLAEAGLDEDSAAAVANALNALVPQEGRKTVSDAQKWRAVLDAAKGREDQKAALLTVMSGSARTRYEIADRYGIQPEAWVQVKEALPQFDANGNGSYSGKEIENAIDALAGDGHLLAPWDKDPIRLSREEKAVLWQLFTGNKSGGGNPYSTRVGKKVAAELEKAREEE